MTDTNCYFYFLFFSIRWFVG